MVEKSSRAHEPAAGVAEWDADSDVSKFGCADESDSPETDRVSFEGCFRGTITLILGVIYLYDADLQCTRYKKMEDIITMQAASADLTDIRPNSHVYLVAPPLPNVSLNPSVQLISLIPQYTHTFTRMRRSYIQLILILRCYMLTILAIGTWRTTRNTLRCVKGNAFVDAYLE
ncbi:hypothetical protein BDP27DRAFT_1370753 [Rhodocollybia butyracea]|uniref:Uncharacterized protein n=1 Tax=Rhodocollybia butyracea TaxID=206335 RepID=A0A9P5P7B1_9AGAR|nr:hypothetical protein BDP27DRAFT_1370753 [Rhodocollybia butyracea]